MTDAIEVIARLGETILDVRYVTDGRYTIAGHQLELAIAQPTVVRLGLVELSLRRVDRPRRSIPARAFERRGLSYLAGSLAVHLAIWVAALDVPDEPGIGVDVAESRLLVYADPVMSDPAPWEDGDSPDYDTNGSGAPMQGAAGKSGGESSQTAGHIQVAERHDAPQLTRAEAIAEARRAGILGSTLISESSFKALVGTADLTSAFDDVDINAPLYGGTGEANGTFGLGRSGTALSAGCGGGDCLGTIGVGRYGTFSNGQSDGHGWGGHFSGADSLPRKHLVAVVTPFEFWCACPEDAEAGLDKAIVRRYIKREMPKIQYCYEKALLAGGTETQPTLDTDFLIATDGTVQDVVATGVAAPIASCVADVIRNIKFPRSRNGSTQVHYPFIFRWAGS